MEANSISESLFSLIHQPNELCPHVSDFLYPFLNLFTTKVTLLNQLIPTTYGHLQCGLMTLYFGLECLVFAE